MSGQHGPAGPSGGMIPPGAGTPFAILGVVAIGLLLTGAVWLAGSAVAAVGGAGWAPPTFGFEFAVDVVSQGPAAVWPEQSPATILIVAGVLVAVVFVTPTTVIIARRSGRGSGDPLRSLATEQDVAALAGDAPARARQLRPSLGRRVAAADVGVLLGRLRQASGRRVGAEVRASWEDVVLAVMAPRSGKTTSVAVPAILEAPGPVVATSNKADLWQATAALRRDGTGERVWTFDPQTIIAGGRQDWWWNPLGAVNNVEEAERLASHFMQQIAGKDRGGQDFWSAAAKSLLTELLLAAGLSGRGLDEVYEWLSDATSPTPSDLLREHGQRPAAGSFAGRQSGAPETRDGVYETARTAAAALRDPTIMAWVTRPPRDNVDELDTAAFATSRQTLYLLSKDGAGSAAPLVAALTDRIMRDATRAAEQRGGRLDPPMVAVLDEAANVCKIADLPDLYSHLGSRSIVPITILQSYRQGQRVWGDAGMDAMWSAATVKLVGAGIDDPKLAEDLSKMIGDHDVTTRSVSYGRDSGSQQLSTRRQRILGPDAIRAMPKGTALLLATGARVASIELQPWYDGPRAREISTAIANAGRPTEEQTP